MILYNTVKHIAGFHTVVFGIFVTGCKLINPTTFVIPCHFIRCIFIWVGFFAFIIPAFFYQFFLSTYISSLSIGFSRLLILFFVPLDKTFSISE